MEKFKKWDVAIIGGGVIGNAVAREMARYKQTIVVFEKELDVARGNSCRNTGMLHAGFTYATGSLKAECSVEGNQEFDRVAEELDVPFRRTGKVVVGFNDKDRENILKFKEIGEKNGVKGLEMIDKEKLNTLDSSAGGEFAMYVPDSGILDPMQYTIALAENACMNGVQYRLNHEVKDVRREGDVYTIETSKGIYQAKWVINCAGMYGTEISERLGFKKYYQIGFKGEYFVLDKKAGKHLTIPVYPAPNDLGGFSTHATPTIDGNVLVGPDSYIVENKEDYKVTKEHLDGLIKDGKKMFKYMDKDFFIHNYAGIRWKNYDEETGEKLDFILEFDDEHPNAINFVGIESPGVTCALPLARRAVARLVEVEMPEKNHQFNPFRKGIKRFGEMTKKEQKEAIKNDSNYGEIICRCETVTKAEIMEAINNPLHVKTVTGIKVRTRATMGRCQGGYCETRITTLLEETGKQSLEEVTYAKEEDYVFTGKVRS